MKSQIMHYLYSILFLVSFQVQAMDVSKHKALKPEIQNEIQWELYEATKNNQIERVKLFIKGGTNVNMQDKYGFTPLHNAANKGHLEIVKHLLNADKIDVNKQNNCGFTPLHNAADKGHIEITQQLLKGGADVNKQECIGWTPLHEAAYWSRVEIVQQLLKEGADVNMQDNDGWAPLHIAANRSHIEVAQQLIKAGAVGLNILHNLVGRNKFGYLTANNRAKLIKLLVYNKPMLVHLKNAEGKTALQCAVGLDQHLTNLLQDPKQYIAKHPEEFTFIQDIEYKLQVAECNLLKRTMPNIVHKIRNRELGMPFYTKLKTNKSFRATANNSKRKGKWKALS